MVLWQSPAASQLICFELLLQQVDLAMTALLSPTVLSLSQQTRVHAANAVQTNTKMYISSL